MPIVMLTYPSMCCFVHVFTGDEFQLFFVVAVVVLFYFWGTAKNVKATVGDIRNPQSTMCTALLYIHCTHTVRTGTVLYCTVPVHAIWSQCSLSVCICNGYGQIFRFRVRTHLRVRDMCQYQIKTMSIDWKIIIVKAGTGAGGSCY